MRAVGPLVDSEVQATAAQLPADEDPDSFVRRHGLTALRTLLTTARPIVPFVIDALWQTHDHTQTIRAVTALAQQMHTPLARLAMLHEAEQVLALPAGSLVEALGAGEQGRRELEGVVCGLLLTIPAVLQQRRA